MLITGDILHKMIVDAAKEIRDEQETILNKIRLLDQDKEEDSSEINQLSVLSTAYTGAFLALRVLSNKVAIGENNLIKDTLKVERKNDKDSDDDTDIFGL